MNSSGGKPRKLSSLASFEFIFILFFPESKVEGNKKEGKDSVTEKQFKIVSIFLAENFRTLGYNAPEISCSKVHSVREILLLEKNSLKDMGTD